MPRFNVYRIACDDRARRYEELARLLARLESSHEIRAFIFDMFSLPETVMFMRRIEVAALLARGETYEEIVRKTGASRTLIKDMSYRLARNGEGFAVANERLAVIREELDAEIRRAGEVLDPASWESLMRKTWMSHWPELLGRELPKIARDMAAARKRKKGLTKT